MLSNLGQVVNTAGLLVQYWYAESFFFFFFASFSGNPPLEEEQQQQQPQDPLNIANDDAESLAKPAGSNACRNTNTKSTRKKTASTSSRRHGRAKKTVNIDTNQSINRGCLDHGETTINIDETTSKKTNLGRFGVGPSHDAFSGRKDGGCRDCERLSRANLKLRRLLNRVGRQG